MEKNFFFRFHVMFIGMDFGVVWCDNDPDKAKKYFFWISYVVEPSEKYAQTCFLKFWWILFLICLLVNFIWLFSINNGLNTKHYLKYVINNLSDTRYDFYAPNMRKINTKTLKFLECGTKDNWAISGQSSIVWIVNRKSSIVNRKN